MGKGDYLGEFEQIVLLALIRLGANAYGVRIRQEIAKRTNRNVSIGSVYATLERLERKGFVSSFQGSATAERGGRAKRYFKVDARGETALNESRNMLYAMWDGVVVAEA